MTLQEQVELNQARIDHPWIVKQPTPLHVALYLEAWYQMQGGKWSRVQAFDRVIKYQDIRESHNAIKPVMRQWIDMVFHVPMWGRD